MKPGLCTASSCPSTTFLPARCDAQASYFLGVLTSVAIDTAYRPYWARSASATFSNVGSTIGSDAGINLFHEFRPGILQMVRGHTPKFVSKIEKRITRDQAPRDAVSPPAR
jgi:hypothetical protein